MIEQVIGRNGTQSLLAPSRRRSSSFGEVMNDLWKKLNLKDQSPIVVVDAPESFESQIEALTSTEVIRTCGRTKKVEFLLAFVLTRSAIKRIADQVAKKAEGDAVIWFAYPKKTSKNYRCDFSRDEGWEPVTDAGFRGIRMVAIDDDWAALRFRRREFVRSRR